MKVNNNKPGAKKLAENIIHIARKNDIENIQIGMEATNVYWEHLFNFLQHHEDLTAENKLSLFTLNPKVVKNFKGAYNDLPKNDRVDAWVIADRLRFGRVESSSAPETVYKALRQLTRFRFKQGEQLSKEKSRALNLIFLKFSDFASNEPFGTFSKASMALMEEYSQEEIIQADMEELVEFAYNNSNNRLASGYSLEEVSKALKKAARDSYRLKPRVNQAITQTLSMTFDNIRFLQQQMKKAKKAIKRELKAIPQTLSTVDGIGPILASGIISEIQDVNRFDNEAKIASFAGLTWNKHQSGSFTAEESSLSKSGNHYLRYYLVEAANSLRVHNEEYRQYYYKKYNEVNKHRHKRALVLTARKFVRLVFALLSKGEIYQPRR